MVEIIKTIGKTIVLVIWTGHISYTICLSGNLPKNRRALENHKGISDAEYETLRERLQVQSRRDKWDLAYASGFYSLLLYLMS